jgi:hypothetical protein
MLDNDGQMVAGPNAEHPGATNEFGIEETSDVLESLIKIANAVKVTMEDGKFSPMEAFNFTGALVSLPKALSGLKFVPAELDNLSDDEIAILVETVKDELEYASDEKVQAIITQGLKAAIAIKDLIGVIKDA